MVNDKNATTSRLVNFIVGYNKRCFWNLLFSLNASLFKEDYGIHFQGKTFRHFPGTAPIIL